MEEKYYKPYEIEKQCYFYFEKNSNMLELTTKEIENIKKAKELGKVLYKNPKTNKIEIAETTPSIPIYIKRPVFNGKTWEDESTLEERLEHIRFLKKEVILKKTLLQSYEESKQITYNKFLETLETIDFDLCYELALKGE